MKEEEPTKPTDKSSSSTKMCAPSNEGRNLQARIQPATVAEAASRETASVPFKPSVRLYAIVVGLGTTNVLAALENTVVSAAAPVLVTDLQLGDNFIWITNALFLARQVKLFAQSSIGTAILPLFCQFCNIFGRRYVMLAVVGAFVLDSGICSGASTGGMLIAGRAVQGVGSGGIIMVTSIILSDLIPLC
ncbi:hypothetical protein Hte_008782 [Hypoxylon texense]